MANAYLTYIQHGGDKSRAIEKFLDKHLRTYTDVETFLQKAAAASEVPVVRYIITV